jgi:hypothetical protein
MEQIQPDKVIMSSKAPEALIEKVTAWCKLNAAAQIGNS